MSEAFETVLAELTPEQADACARVLLRELEGQKKPGAAALPVGDDRGGALHSLAEAAAQVRAQLERAEQAAARIAAGGSQAGAVGTSDAARNGEPGQAGGTARRQEAVSAAAAAYRTRQELAELSTELRPVSETRRYEGEPGRRDLDMGRMSDYFRRDSRRYDAGFVRY